MLPIPPATLPPIDRLRAIVAALRGPGGCPWDQEQTHASIRSGLIEEAYEVIDAIDARDDENLREELGDLLLQVVFHSQIATEEGRFDLDAVAHEHCEKLIRRHPHVFGDQTAADSTEVLKKWEEIKRAEKAGQRDSLLDGISGSLPALSRAQKTQKKAAKVGFDWSEAAPVFAKVREELAEIESAPPDKIEEEVGDLLFSVVNLARKLHIDAESALHGATRKFSTRFRQIELFARERNLTLDTMTLAQLDELWDEVKARE